MLQVSSSALVLVALLSTSAFGQTKTTQPAPVAAGEKAQIINLNTATSAELERLPGIGPKVAARIVDYRTKKGPFHKVEEIMETSRSGPCSLSKSCSATFRGVSRSR